MTKGLELRLTQKKTTVYVQSMDDGTRGGDWARSNFLTEDLGGFIVAAHEDRSELGLWLTVRDNDVYQSVSMRCS